MPFIAIYISLFAGIFISGEFVFVSAVIGASQHHYNIWILLPIAFIATWGSDLMFYELGMRKGEQWLEKKRMESPKAQEFIDILDRRENVLLFTYRFIFGFRMVILMIFGSMQIRRAKFFVFSGVATGIWVIFYCSLGMLFGKAITTLLHDYKQVEFYIIGLFLATTLLLGIRRLMRNRGL